MALLVSSMARRYASNSYRMHMCSKLNLVVSQIYVADDDEAFERFKIAYPEINVGVFDMSNDVSYTQMTEQNVYKVTNLAFGFISGCHQADKTFVAEIEHVQNTVKDFVLARADSVKHKTDYLTIHMTSLEVFRMELSTLF
jgi:hypothetical protein